MDRAEFPGADLGDEVADLVALIVTLSWSRKRAVVWARSKDMLSWQTCQIACFRRLGEAPAARAHRQREDGDRPGRRGLGRDQRDLAALCGAAEVPCRRPAQPRHPQGKGKGKVERHVRDLRETVDPRREAFDTLEQLQAVTDARLAERAARLRCPTTGASINEAWEQERRLLTPLPETLPEPFDVVVRRPVSIDCLVSFEGRRYESCRSASPFRRWRCAGSPVGSGSSGTPRRSPNIPAAPIR